MSRLFKILLVGFALGFELIFVGTFNPYPHGEIHDVRYRQHERVAAMIDYRLHPSPASEATFHEELRLMHKHEDWKGYAALGLLVALNVVGIYFFLKHEQQKPMA
jgi:hypothetical protein